MAAINRPSYRRLPDPCRFCGSAVYASRDDAQYCSHNCKKAASRQRLAKPQAHTATHQPGTQYMDVVFRLGF